MKRALQVVVLVVGLMLLVLPTANMLWPFYVERPLQGALAVRARPTLTAQSAFDEQFQKGFTAWYEQSYGVRATATRFDNEINFALLHETRPEKPVHVGRDDVLFLDEHLWFYSSRTDGRVASDAFAKLARLVQNALDQQGKELLVLVVPAKTTFYAAEVPPRWTLDLGSKRPSETLLYEPFVEALAREGVRFVDGRKLLLTELAGRRELAYLPTGRHLNAPGACLILEKGLDLVRERVPVTPLDCRFESVRLPNLDEEEFDLLRLLNGFADKPANAIPQVLHLPDRAPAKDAPDALFVGSSFAWRIIKEAERNHAFGKTACFYYNKTVALRDGSPDFPVPAADSPEWRELVFGRRLIVLPLPEEYLPLHDADFLLQLAAALGVDARPFERALTP
jgi:hypothetical protein